MTADTFEAALVADLPELASDLRALQDSWGDDKPGLHIVVGDVLAPYVKQSVDASDGARLQNVCDFLERMATSPDEQLVNALAVSLLEGLGDDRDRLMRAREAMGPATLALSHEVERFWGRES
jgi:hypothetical protein